MVGRMSDWIKYARALFALQGGDFACNFIKLKDYVMLVCSDSYMREF